MAFTCRFLAFDKFSRFHINRIELTQKNIRIQFLVSSIRFIFEHATWDCANSKTRIYTHNAMVFFFLNPPHTVFSRTSSHLHSLFSLILSQRLPPTSLKFFVEIFSSMNSNEISSLSFYVHNKPLSHDKHINHNTNLCIYAKERGNYACDFMFF